MKKQPRISAFVEAKRAAFNELKKEYAKQLDEEITKAGGAGQLAAALGMSSHYVRVTKHRGSLTNLKNCVERVAQKLYGWKPEKGK